LWSDKSGRVLCSASMQALCHARISELLAYFHHVAVSHKKRLFSAGCNAPPVASPESGARRTDHRKGYISARLSNRSQSRLRVRLVRSFSPHCGHLVISHRCTAYEEESEDRSHHPMIGKHLPCRAVQRCSSE